MIRGVLATLALALAATAAPAQEVTRAPGGVLRGLDKLTGALTDLPLATGESARLGYLTVVLGECRYPSVNPASDAYAFVTVIDSRDDRPVFSGWMLASSPALNALDHPRYDVWVLRCSSS